MFLWAGISVPLSLPNSTDEQRCVWRKSVSACRSSTTNRLLSVKCVFTPPDGVLLLVLCVRHAVVLVRMEPRLRPNQHVFTLLSFWMSYMKQSLVHYVAIWYQNTSDSHLKSVIEFCMSICFVLLELISCCMFDSFNWVELKSSRLQFLSVFVVYYLLLSYCF